MGMWSRALDSIKRLWAALSGAQKLTLAVAAAVMAALLVWGSSAAGAGDGWQRVVGMEVDNAERAEALKSLAQKNVAYEVRHGEIWVPRAEADRVMLELSGDNAISDRAMEIYLKDFNVFASGWEKEKRFQIALQRKLEYMIRKTDGVRNASVQITPASQSHQLGFHGAKASASVLVELKPSMELSRANVQSMVGLVANAVSGLDRDRVHVSDTRGKSYAVQRSDAAFENAESWRDLEARVETELQRKILNLYPNARAEVRAYSRARSEKTTEERHGKVVPRLEEERKEVEEGPAAPAGADFKGADSLLPAGPPARPKKTVSETKVQNIVDRKFIETLDPSGQIEKVSVSVLLPVMTDKDGKDLGASMKAEDVRRSVMNVTGAALDAVSVLMVPARAPEPVAAEPSTSAGLEWFLANWTKIVIALLAFFALLVVARAVRGAMPKGEIEEIRAITSRLGDAVETAGARAGLAVDPQGDLAAVRESIREVVKRSPGDAAAALKAWMAGK